MTAHEILTTEAHRSLRVRTDRGAEFGDAVMSAVAVPTEFRQLQNEYPILFRLNPERDSFSAHAIFGFETGENLFVDGSRWDAYYRPLAMDIQPFLIGRPADGAGEKQVHIDMASPRVGAAEGTLLFDDSARPTPFLDAAAERLGALDAGLEASLDFFNALRRHRLLEALTLEVTLDDGSTNRLVGFQVIDEVRLQQLDAAELADLHAEDHLLHIFMAIASLSNFTNLIARKNRRMAHG